MNAPMIRQAKTILDSVLNEYFTHKLNMESLQFIQASYEKISNLLEVTDHLLHDGLTTAE